MTADPILLALAVITAYGRGAYTAAMESARRWRQHALTALTAAHQPEAPQ